MFRHPVAIDPADIDHMGHVNNAVYLKWVQEAVVDYWRSVAPPDAVARHLLTATPAHDLEITAHALEEAFLNLTGDESDASLEGADA